MKKKTIILLFIFGIIVGNIIMLSTAFSGEPLIFPPNISIIFPVNNSNYFSLSLDLNWTSNETLTTIALYSLDNNNNLSISNVSLCYQESANVSTSCGGLNTGNYSIIGTWYSNPGGLLSTVELIDGNWSSGAQRLGVNGGSSLYINYSKPINALASSLWQVSDSNNIINLTIPSTCWMFDSNILVLRGISGNAGTGSVSWSCLNTTSEWMIIRSFAGGNILYEEAMWWNLSTSFNTTLTSLSEGKHNVTIYGNDSGGNAGQSSYVYFTINQTPQWSNNKTNITSNTQLNDVGQFNVTLIDNFNLSSAIFSWNVSGVWENLTQINYTLITTSTTLIENRTINQSSGKHKAWTVYFNDSIGNKNQTDIFTFNIKNQLPSVASASINNTLPLDADDLQCNNGSVSDSDDDTVILMYNWTKGGVDQAISTKTLSNALTSANDVWICKITPFDGYENGTTKTSSSVSIGTNNAAPIINFTNSTPLTAELLKGEWLNLSVNFTDTNNEDKHTAYFCKTDSATTDGCSQTFCSSPINTTGNYTSCRLNITNITDFPLGITSFYAFVVDNTSLISASKSATFTMQDITPPVLNNWSLQYTNLNDASGNTDQFNVSISDNVSNIQTITFDLNVTLNVTRSFTFAQNLSVAANYLIFQSSETLLKGFYNITKVTVTDNLSNSQSYNFTNITFTVSEQPSSSSGISGGGGGSITIIEEIIELSNISLLLRPPIIASNYIYGALKTGITRYSITLTANKVLNSCESRIFECNIKNNTVVITLNYSSNSFINVVKEPITLIDKSNNAKTINAKVRFINLGVAIPLDTYTSSRNYIVFKLREGIIDGIRIWFIIVSATALISGIYLYLKYG